MRSNFLKQRKMLDTQTKTPTAASVAFSKKMLRLLGVSNFVTHGELFISGQDNPTFKKEFISWTERESIELSVCQLRGIVSFSKSGAYMDNQALKDSLSVNV